MVDNFPARLAGQSTGELQTRRATVTRDDVARLAGVSTATVSYVVNRGPRPVSAEARAAVLRAVEALGYSPNRTARALARPGSRLLAFMTPDVTNPILAMLAAEIDRVASESGYVAVTLGCDGDVDRIRIRMDAFVRNRIDGLLMVTPGIGADALRSALRAEIPTVLVEREIPGADVDMVLVDNVDIGRQATEHLLEHGHAVVGCVGGPGAAGRIRGFREALILGERTVYPDLIQMAEPSVEHGEAVAGAMLASDARPTAIFATNDRMAAGVIRAAHAAGVRVPEGLAVVSADDSYVSLATSPPLTAVAMPIQEMARLAVSILLDRIRGQARTKPLHVELRPGLVIRGSCGCPTV
ncbi:MAG: LacI family DNA-binding transcriptional regulator [Chloroflexota bacterium]